MSAPPKRSPKGSTLISQPEANCIGRISDRSGDATKGEAQRGQLYPARELHRICRIPLAALSARQWLELRRLALLSANFGNHLLNESYAKAKGVSGLRPYTDYRTLLSAAVRDAISRECMGIWRRIGKQIMRGEQTLARFSAARALVVRETGVAMEHITNQQLVLRIRLLPRGRYGATVLAVWMPALLRDRWLADVVEKLESGAYRTTKLTLTFERPGRKVAALISFAMPAQRSAAGANAAKFEYLGDECRLYSEGHVVSFNDAIYRLVAMKSHFAGIHSRLRKHLGKNGRRRTLQRTLLKAGSFDGWALGPLHQLSRSIVHWCLKHNIGVLHWTVDQRGELPWARLASMVQYKSEAAGIRFLPSSVKAASTGSWPTDWPANDETYG